MGHYRIIGHPFMHDRMHDWSELPRYEYNKDLDVHFKYSEFYDANNWSAKEDQWYERGMDVIVEIAEVIGIPRYDNDSTFLGSRFVVARFKDVESAIWFKLTIPEEAQYYAN